MIEVPAQLHKTISDDGVKRPEVTSAAAALKRTARRLWFKRVPFAVNGMLKMRWRIKWNKLWEYSRGLAYGDFQADLHVLDFSGGNVLEIRGRVWGSARATILRRRVAGPSTATREASRAHVTRSFSDSHSGDALS